MRKLLLSLLLLSAITFSVSSAASLTVAAGAPVPASLEAQLRSALEREAGYTAGGNMSAHIADAVEAEGGIYILTLEIDGSVYRIAVDSNDRHSAENVLHELLQYSLEEGEGAVLDYIYGSSYSSTSITGTSNGRVYRLKDDNGRTIASFIGGKNQYGAVALAPFYIKEAYTGLPLEKGIGLKISAAANLIFAPDFRAGGKALVSYLPLLYPFSPVTGFSYLPDRNGGGVYSGLLGVSYTLSLGSVFPLRFTLVEDGAVSASVYLSAGYDGGFAWGGGWSVQYEHALSSWLYWFMGGGQDVIWSMRQSAVSVNQYSLNIGMGVLL